MDGARMQEVGSLVLERKIGESFVIAENIRVEVVSVKGNKVRFRTSAPRNVTIRRAELAPRSGTSAM